MKYELLNGPVEDILPTLAPSSFDAAFCDPPYGLGFMGKAWDHGVPGAPIWAEILRALRPGAHLLAFGGTRTFHRLTVGIEDGGFEIRDCLAWLYGSGFPKSLDVSAAIDKAAGATRQEIGRKNNGEGWGVAAKGAFKGGFGYAQEFAVTAPATDSAKVWSGYGTSLKPAWEPCVLAMKPLDGTFAANALRHGVAGLAIDAGRIASEGGSPAAARRANAPAPSLRAGVRDGPIVDRSSPERYADPRPGEALGRWPANVLLDEEAAAALDAQSGWSQSREGTMSAGFISSSQIYGDGHKVDRTTGACDSGGASRFFYTAKADRGERQGSKHPTLKPLDLCAYMARLLLPPPRADGAPRRILVPFSGAGSEMIGCLRAGWEEVVGIEKDTECGYIADARRRIAAEFGLLVKDCSP